MDILKFDKIIEKTKEDKYFATSYLKELYNYHFDNIFCPIKCDYPLANIKNFIPLPSKFSLGNIYEDNNKITKDSNMYSFIGTPGNRIIFSDKILPYSGKYKQPIPFSFPVYNDLDVEIMLSNVYYYEVTIEDTVNINQDWFQKCVSIGFGNKEVPFKSHAGWFKNSIGYHSDDGKIYNNNGSNGDTTNMPWSVGDTAGAGIVYVEKNQILPFFTLNGNMVKIMQKPINMLLPYFPIIGYDHSNSISVNFSTSQFKFDIKKFINKHSNITICTDNNFIEDGDISAFINEMPINDINQQNLNPIVIGFNNENINTWVPNNNNISTWLPDEPWGGAGSTGWNNVLTTLQNINNQNL